MPILLKRKSNTEKISRQNKELEEVTTKLDANINAQYDVVSRMQEIAVKAYGHDKGFKKYNVAKKAEEEITIPIKMPEITYRLLVKKKAISMMMMEN